MNKPKETRTTPSGQSTFFSLPTFGTYFERVNRTVNIMTVRLTSNITFKFRIKLEFSITILESNLRLREIGDRQMESSKE